MKVYQFLDENEKGIGTCHANSHEEAVHKLASSGVTLQTDFYSFESDVEESE